MLHSTYIFSCNPKFLFRRISRIESYKRFTTSFAETTDTEGKQTELPPETQEAISLQLEAITHFLTTWYLLGFEDTQGEKEGMLSRLVDNALMGFKNPHNISINDSAHSTLKEAKMTLEKISQGHPQIIEASSKLTKEIKNHINFIENEHYVARKLYLIFEKKLPQSFIEWNFNRRYSYGSDASNIRCETPIAVFQPQSTEELQEMIQIANLVAKETPELKYHLIPRGSGVGFTGGCVPLHERVITVSTERLRTIQDAEYDETTEQHSIWCQAGAINIDVDKKAKQSNKHFAFTVDPDSRKVSTVGGNLAEGAAGPMCFEYGGSFDNILAWRFIDAQGQRFEVERTAPLPVTGRITADQEVTFHIRSLDENTSIAPKHITLKGSKIRKIGLAKDVTNKFLKGLPGIQKEGVDVIITETQWALHELPKHRKSLFIQAYDTAKWRALINDLTKKRESLGHNRSRILQLEQWDGLIAKVTKQLKKSDRIPVSSFGIEIAGETEEDLEVLESIILRHAEELEGNISVSDENPWNYRKTGVQAISADTGAKLNEDVVVPLPKLALLLDHLDKLDATFRTRWKEIKSTIREKYVYDDDSGKKFDHTFFRICSFGHFADGNMHVTIPVNPQYTEMLELAEEVLETSIFPKVVELGGVWSGEHGLGLAKLKLALSMARKNDPYAQDLVSHLRETRDNYTKPNDPNDIIHPGGLDPDDPAMERTYTPNVFALSETARKLSAQLAERYKEDPAFQEKNPYGPSLVNAVFRTAKAIENCVRCGNCKNACHWHTPEEGKFWSPFVKIRPTLEILMMVIDQMNLAPKVPLPKEIWKNLHALLKACTKCGQCEMPCPVDINTGNGTKGIEEVMVTASVKHRTIPREVGKKALKQFGLSKFGKDEFPIMANIIGWFDRQGLLPEFIRNLYPLNTSTKAINPLDYVEGDQGKGIFIPGIYKNTNDALLLWFGCGDLAGEAAMASVFLTYQTNQNTILIGKGDKCCGLPCEQMGVPDSVLQKINIANISKILDAAKMRKQKVSRVKAACTTCQTGIKRTLENTSDENLNGVSVDDLTANIIQNLSDNQKAFVQRKLGGKTIHFQHSCHEDSAAFKIIIKCCSEMGINLQVEKECCGSEGGDNLGTNSFEKRANRQGQKIIPISNTTENVALSNMSTSNCPTCEGASAIKVQKRVKETEKDKIPVKRFIVLLAEAIGGEEWIEDTKKVLNVEAFPI